MKRELWKEYNNQIDRLLEKCPSCGDKMRLRVLMGSYE
jgi:ssDNA-binding Zn-finger/Zn-ribbon topoisomerase 1